MRIVAALGGNALLPRGAKPGAAVERSNAALAVALLAPIASQHELVITHGNGPQLGVLADRATTDTSARAPYPMDVIGAQTQGMIGYWLVQALQNNLPDREVLAVLTQVLVDPTDPAFEDPTKFVGEIYDDTQARHLSAQRGWRMKQDGSSWRRVVPSPRPQRVLEAPTVRRLVDQGVLVICGGGGGVPVVPTAAGHLEGTEAVIDKDSTSALLAEELDADLLLLLTDVPNVYRDWQGVRSAPIGRVTTAALRAEDFAEGSMGPKVRAAQEFVERTGGVASIGQVRDALAIIRGQRGTTITSGEVPTLAPRGQRSSSGEGGQVIA